MAQESGPISAVTFRGNLSFSDEDLLNQLSLSIPDWFSRTIQGTRGSAVDLVHLDKYSDALRGFYQREGFLYVSVLPPVAEVDEAEKAVRLTVEINERRPVRIDSVVFSVDVDSPGQEETIQSLLSRTRPFLNLARGDRFRDADVEKDEDIIIEAFARSGYPFVAPRPDLLINEPDTSVTLTWFIDSGPLSTFGPVSFRGSEHIDESLLTGRLAFEQGEVYDVQKVKKSQKDLYALGVFTAATLSPQFDDQSSGVVPIAVRLQDAKAFRTKFGAGYGKEDRFRASVEMSLLRFLGGTRTLDVRARRSAIEPYYVSLVFTQPDVLIGLTRLVVNPLLFREIQPAYTATRVGINVTLSYPASLYTDAWLTYRAEQVQQDSVASTGNRGGVAASLYNKSSITLAGSYDSSLPLFDPITGLNIRGGVTYGGLFQAPRSQYLQPEIDMRAYVTIEDHPVFALRLALGTILELSEDTEVPIEERFFAGGASSVRGYGRSSLGPQATDGTPLGGLSGLVGSVEFRFPLSGALGGVVFSDFGNVWGTSLTYRLRELAASAGVGLRYETPIGPVRLDLATPIFQGRRPAEFYFSLGHAF